MKPSTLVLIALLLVLPAHVDAAEANRQPNFVVIFIVVTVIVVIARLIHGHTGQRRRCCGAAAAAVAAAAARGIRRRRIDAVALVRSTGVGLLATILGIVWIVSGTIDVISAIADSRQYGRSR